MRMKIKDLKDIISKFDDNCDVVLTQYVVDDEKKECIEIKYGDIIIAANGKKESEDETDEQVCKKSDVFAIVPQIQFNIAAKKISEEKYEIKSAEAKIELVEDKVEESKAEEQKGE